MAFAPVGLSEKVDELLVAELDVVVPVLDKYKSR
jgi:hypothetical protein